MNIFELSKSMHDRCMEALGRLKFNGHYDADGPVVMIYATLIELFGAYLVLADRRQRAGTSPIFRSFLEAYVDFANLVSDDSYKNNLELTYLHGLVQFLEAAERGNRFLVPIASQHGFQDRLKDCRRWRRDLEDRGIRRLSIEERFARANLSDEYEAIYRLESRQSHNDLSALMGRHLEDASDRYQLVLYRVYVDGEFVTHLDTICRLLANATNRLHDRLTAAPPKFDDILGHLESAAPAVE